MMGQKCFDYSTIWLPVLLCIFGCNNDSELAVQPRDGASARVPQASAGETTAADLPVPDASESDDAAASRSAVATFVSSGSRRHALLVGCSEYSNLGEWIQLRGPVNDVVLMRQLLIDRFEFDAARDDLVTLAAAEDAEHQPTRANIQREFRRLGESVQPGEFVVILMGGHGSQQPDNDPENPEDPEPDGRDEIFMPSDVKKWDDKQGTVENAIVDDELRGWLAKIVGRGAMVWLIMDACHSGSGVRGNDSEVSRQVPTEELVPHEAFRQAKSAAESDTTVSAAESSLFRVSGAGGIVAIYAAQPDETTPERLLPQGASSDAQKYYGLLTYTICEILANAKQSLTYTELVQAIQTRYITMGRRSPTPLLEGSHRDNLVLGREAFPERSRIVLEKIDASRLKINAGALQGLSADTILAVYPPTGSEAANPSQPMGHVRVFEAGLTSALVQACEYNGLPADENLPNRGRCEVVYQDFGQQQLRVAVDRRDAAGQPVADATYARVWGELRSESSPLVAIVDDAQAADWLARWDGRAVRLFPAAGISRSDEAGHQEALPPLQLQPGWSETAIQDLERVARAQNLLRLTSVVAGSAHENDLGFELQVIDSATQSPVQWQASGVTLNDGQRVRVMIKNGGNQSLDVTLLYVDSAYGITCLYPNLGEFNRLSAGDEQPVNLTINAATTGIENLVAIVVRGAGQPADFSILEQPSIRLGTSRGFGDGALSTPLGELCRSVMYGSGGTRGVRIARVQDYATDVLSWRIQP